MEAPPPLSAPPPIPTTSPTAALHPDSVDSSPTSRHTDSWDSDHPLPNQQLSQKLRLMCSYGGHIVPRPHDKNLCYIGGDTRIIVIDRHTSLSDLHHRLSKTLLQNQSFSLKYQIPNEDLDSLISVSTDEDLDNMVEEYDRLCNNSVGGASKPGRLRLFLFPKSSSNIEQILVETASTKSDDWFFNALNCKASPLSAGGASDRGFSESSSVNCLLGLDDDPAGKAAAAAAAAAGGKDAEALIDGSKIGSVNHAVNHHDVHSLPDSPMLDTTSSFGSTSSSPSVANLPPIRVHVEENPKVAAVAGIEDQFQQMAVGVVAGGGGNVNLVQMQKQDEIGGSVAAGVAAGAVVSGVPVVVGGGDYSNRVFSDDERSDHSGTYRKVQQIQPQVQVQFQPQQIPQIQQRQQTVAFDLASPDSVSSEGSVTNPLSRQRQTIYQDSIMQIPSSNTARVVPANQIDLKNVDQTNTKVQIQQQQPQLQESGYILSGQFDQNHPQFHHPQQQYIHTGNQQYIPAGAVPMTSYYPIYPSQQQQQQQQQHQPILDQQYPFYFIPARQNQPYSIPMQQSSYNDFSPTAVSNRPQNPPPTAMAPPQTAYNQVINNPSSKPEMAAAGGMYRPQYVGYTQIHPSQSVSPSSAAAAAAAAAAANNSTYTYEYADPNMHAQIYYNQQPQMAAAQYQTMTSSPSPTVVLSDASSAQQLPTENLKQQQVRTVQQ